MQRVSVFGSTGCIGQKTVQLLLKNPNKYKVEVLTADSNFELLARQARLVNAKNVVIADKRFFRDLKESLSDTKINVEAGSEGLAAAASIPIDRAVVAIVGIAGLMPTMKIIESKTKIIALANKESIICGGGFMLRKAKEHKVKIVPIDSEHNAIFQIFHSSYNLDKIVLTASGGPFLHLTYEQMQNVTLRDAMSHPIWKMGKKNSIDSATMMNKALELIEAQNLFAVGLSKLDVVIHPESIVHGVVSYKDGSNLAVLACPDMDIPISYALSWPRRSSITNKQLDLTKQKLTFFEPDYNQFPALKLAMEVLRSNTPHANSIILNAANEIATGAFVESRIGFLDIAKIVQETLAAVKITANFFDSLDNIIDLDSNSRILAERLINSNYVSSRCTVAL
ncbi:1-deoxy-D-xylulose-5-phosphate reductoisomerase [Candidatus Mesenet endosymbiont of Phosphuga atrata]|uniref:1-deoxy-D-xylulose-5-phosphate reductoisomerase n=1 Tax=Candidatus Mesenet endosymbiont of Phosphuga atrata TaxID=3066221 RepID=UPI0030D031B7